MNLVAGASGWCRWWFKIRLRINTLENNGLRVKNPQDGVYWRPSHGSQLPFRMPGMQRAPVGDLVLLMQALHSNSPKQGWIQVCLSRPLQDLHEGRSVPNVPWSAVAGRRRPLRTFRPRPVRRKVSCGFDRRLRLKSDSSTLCAQEEPLRQRLLRTS
ncbi:hypothetical protein L596_007714 [Steinernema carpocapsae]|uniref:Uncharacterized protein n=1 Tax=Steinernema carpocapsae TaxID=34508 RepID=A0A4U5PAA0_STECR|nr:hypothetical protein L596_007714 [Steinernema carpocapsae]